MDDEVYRNAAFWLGAGIMAAWFTAGLVAIYGISKYRQRERIRFDYGNEFGKPPEHLSIRDMTDMLESHRRIQKEFER